MNSQSFGIICEKFSKLEKPELENCEKLTDEDGVKFSLLRNLSNLAFFD